MMQPFRILALNGSPRGTRSNTDRMLQPFLAGARAAGAETETLYVRDLQIRDCLGCFSCWKQTPGRCVIQGDDMASIMEKYREADAVIWATPLYHYGMTAALKRVLERTLPLMQPYIVKRGDHYLHPPRYLDLPKKTVLIANCGFPEKHHFHALIEQFKLLTDDPEKELTTILCPAGELLGQPALQEHLSWYGAALQEAGLQYVREGSLQPETAALLDKKLVTLEAFLGAANASWEAPGEKPPTLQEALGKPAAASESPADSHPLPPPNSATITTVKDLIAGMALNFQPERATGETVTIAFAITDEQPGRYFLHIADGQCQAYCGIPEQADLTIHTPSTLWLAISRGEESGEKALLEGRYQITGSLGLLTRMNQLFGSSPAPVEEKRRPEGPIQLSGMAWLNVALLGWIFFWSVSGLPGINPHWFTGVPLLWAIGLWTYRRIYNSPTWLDTGSTLAFSALYLLLLVAPESYSAYQTIISYLAMGGIWLSSLGRTPSLTAEYSAWEYPAAMTQGILFHRTNRIMTAVWAGLFFTMAMLYWGIAAIPGPLWISKVAINLLFLPTIWFNRWFPKWYPTHIMTKEKPSTL